MQRRHIVSFNQINLLEFLSNGGTCAAYVFLYFTYVQMHKLRFPDQPIDYSKLVTVFKNFNVTQRVELNDLQDKYKDGYSTDWKDIHDKEIAVLTNNLSYPTLFDMDGFTKLIASDIKRFTKPIFYFFHFWDLKQKLFGACLAHSVAFYIVSPKEIHFFDANSGVHILNLPANFTEEALERELLNLIFKTNFVFQWFFTHDSGTLRFCYDRSSEIIDHKNPQLSKIKNCLLTYINKPEYYFREINFDDIQKDSDKRFLKMNISVINHLCANKPVINIKTNSINYSILSGMFAFLASYHSTENILFSIAVGTLVTMLYQQYSSNINQPIGKNINANRFYNSFQKRDDILRINKDFNFETDEPTTIQDINKINNAL